MQRGPHTLLPQTFTLSCSLGRDNLLMGRFSQHLQSQPPRDERVMSYYWFLPQDRFGHGRVKRSRGADLPGGELAALGLGLDHPSSYLGCSACGCSSPWHHLVTRGLKTRHWRGSASAAQALLSSLPGEMTLPVVGRAHPWPLDIRGPHSNWNNLFCATQRKPHLGQQHPSFHAGDTERSIPTTGSKPVSALTVWDQSDVLGVGAQEVVHGAPEEQGLVHPVQLQGAVDAVQPPLRLVRGVGPHADLGRLVPQQPGGLSLGAAPDPERIKAPERQQGPHATMGCPGMCASRRQLNNSLLF